MRYSVLLCCLLGATLSAQTFDVVIHGGRVIDPETKIDAIRDVGIRSGSIAAISETPLQGKTTIDATGLVVAPGFIDLHSHGQDDENYRYKAMDGVTTALELERGAYPVGAWYRAREGKALINFGASSGHLPARMSAMGDPPEFLPSQRAAKEVATAAEQKQTLEYLRLGLTEGGLGVGMGIAYVPAASKSEILDVFQLAGRFHAPVFVHMRAPGRKDPGVVESLQEMIADSIISGAPVHIVHVNSMSGPALPQALAMIDSAHKNGVDITTETYDYTAGNTRLDSAIFNPGWQEALEITYKDLLWVATGERLTAETFSTHRKEGGPVIVFSMKDADIDLAVSHPGVIIASDGWIDNGKGHPRGAGCFARVLSTYVLERKALTLMEAIRKMSLLPALRLEGISPAMHRKGRLQPGADADIAIFDPATIRDNATYQNPAQYSSGMRYVLVHGQLVVRDGELLTGVYPGTGVTARFF